MSIASTVTGCCGKIGQAVSTAAHFVTDVAKRGLPLDEERVIVRLEICKTNECGQHVDGGKEERRCNACGCFLDMIPVRVPVLGRAGRSRWQKLDCPMGLWPKLD